MKAAVVGPIAKDIVTIDGFTRTYCGGIPYYEGRALAALGADVTAFVTYAKEDEAMVLESFQGIKIVPLYAARTIVHKVRYASKDPDVRKIQVVEYDPNSFPISDDLINRLKTFDAVFLGPLYHENIPYEFFEKMKGSRLVLNNFGMFTYNDNGNHTRKNPENLARVAGFLDCLCLDEAEITFASGMSGIEEGAEYFLTLGTRSVIVTRGSQGSVIFSGGRRYHIPAFLPGKLLDPTGAGDTYLAAFIFSEELFGSDMQKRGEFAAMAATISIEREGALASDSETVLARLKAAIR